MLIILFVIRLLGSSTATQQSSSSWIVQTDKEKWELTSSVETVNESFWRVVSLHSVPNFFAH